MNLELTVERIYLLPPAYTVPFHVPSFELNKSERKQSKEEKVKSEMEYS